MERRVEHAGLRRHRPKRRFRYEYIIGRFSGLTSKMRRWRAFDEMEKEQDGYLALVERYERYKSGRGVGVEDE
ncbi:MAG: hypothetical protein JOZ96_19100 [Acidobacteria bacterium]|nr:hypothetical protein [Acidobacteriota bacterium]